MPNLCQNSLLMANYRSVSIYSLCIMEGVSSLTRRKGDCNNNKKVVGSNPTPSAKEIIKSRHKLLR